MVVCKFFQQGNCRYGDGCRFEHIYGSKYSYRAPQVQSNTGHNVSSGQGLNNTASSVFRTAARNMSSYENVSSHALTINQTQRPSVFDSLGSRESSIFSTPNNQARSIFAQANQSVFGQPQPAVNVFQSHNQITTNIFRTQNDTAAKSLFAQATHSIFGKNHPTTNTIQNMITEPQKNISNSNNVTENVFKITNTQGSNVFASDIRINNDGGDIYSRIEDLTQIDIDAFESADFKLGFIPELPPPMPLCV